ncbi:hypothetical protein AOXY_G5736 [Acipenser oxyrinchus oxyrinchus]|uniref:Uncharacterized protein n=1 Tax=Acipenser oxyrinchus oxyrinchus TaxID=40147 RepID=A0AAD8GEL5_ACIOX|nr:hypothetical protein AOXY_G5736 [Acipenser oxyrinchus oxyrinchus]
MGPNRTLDDMSIQSFEVYSREPLPVPVIVCNGGTGRDGSVQRLSATSQRQTTYEEMHEENDADEEVDEEAEGEVVCYIHYDEMEQAPGPAAQSASFQSHSSDSCSIHTCWSRAPTSSSYQSVEDLKAMLQVPPQAFRTEYNDTASQTTENTARPEVQHIVEHYRTEHKESGHNIAGLDRSSNFNSNATMKLEKFFNGKLKAASHSPDPANSCDNETGLYENVDEAFEDESASCPPAAHSSHSHKQKTSHCFSVSPHNLAHSPSLERIRMMMDKTHHVQHLQAQFEKQIQTSKRQQEREKRIWSREKVKQMTLSSRPKGTRVKDKSKAKAKGKRSDERISCQEQVIPRAWTTEVQGRRKVRKSERLELPVDDQHERRNARTGPQTSQKTALLHSQGMRSPGLEMSDLMQKHMEFCKACNLAEHLDSCSSMWCIGDRHQQRAEKGMKSMNRRSKEKDLEVQRWIEKCASEVSRRSRSSNKYPDCHKGLKQACACDTCHTLDKKRGRSREAPRKSYQNLRESQEYGHQHYERPKASRSWINVIPHAEIDSQYRENMPKVSSSSGHDLLDIPEGLYFCSNCKKSQQGSHVQHQLQPQPQPKPRPKHYQYHPNTTTQMCRGRPRGQLGVPEPVTSLQWLTQKMRETDQVKSITGVFERRARKDAELLERERLTELFKMLELNKSQKDRRGEDHRCNLTQHRVREEQQRYKEKPKVHQHVCCRDRRNEDITRLQEQTCYSHSHNHSQRHRGNYISS